MTALLLCLVFCLSVSTSANLLRRSSEYSTPQQLEAETKEMEKRARNPYSWQEWGKMVGSKRVSRNPYSWMRYPEEKRSRNPYSWMAEQDESISKRVPRFVVDDIQYQPRNPYSWQYTMFDKRTRNPYSWQNY